MGDALSEKPGQPLYVDPASQFLAPSVDSYLTKKTLLEVKVYLARIRQLDDIIKELGTRDIGFRVKIWAGERFWTATPFVRPSMKRRGGVCEFRQTFRVRVNPRSMDTVTISLWVCPLESGRLPDVLESLKRELSLGFSRLRLSAIPEQRKVFWIPLNNGIYPDKPFAEENDPMISLNYRLLPNLPGNFPESVLSGKQYTIGDAVYFTDKAELSYPGTRAEFDLLQRRDIEFDQDKAGMLGTPLRYPATEAEWRAADLESTLYRYEKKL